MFPAEGWGRGGGDVLSPPAFGGPPPIGFVGKERGRHEEETTGAVVCPAAAREVGFGAMSDERAKERARRRGKEKRKMGERRRRGKGAPRVWGVGGFFFSSERAKEVQKLSLAGRRFPPCPGFDFCSPGPRCSWVCLDLGVSRVSVRAHPCFF